MVKKISIIGSGAVGSKVAYNILSKLWVEELVLIDIDGCLAKGVVLDLEDTRQFLQFNTTIKGGDDYSLIKDSDLVIVTCGKARKEGMKRMDLISTNAQIIKQVADKIREFSPDSIIIVITNPVDFATYLMLKQVKAERNRVLGIGSSLDAARLLNLIYQEIKISPADIESYVMGLHTRDMLPLIEDSRVWGIGIDKFLSAEKKNTLRERVSLRGTEIVGLLRRRSASFAPALACYQVVEAIVKNTNKIICLSAYLDGEYGLREVCMGVPCLVNKEGIARIFQLELKEREKEVIVSKVKNYFQECLNISKQ